MDTTELIHFISLYDDKRPSNAAKTHPTEYSALVRATNYLPTTASFKQRAHHIRSGEHVQPLCKYCNTIPVRWGHRYNRYLTFCSRECNNADGGLHEKRKITLLEKYGVDHYSKSLLFNKQFSQTCLKRYGAVHYNKNSEFVEKIQQTKLKKYGRVNNNMVHISDASMDKLNDREWLSTQHEVQHCTLSNIKDQLGDVSLQAVRTAFNKLQIPTRRFFTSMGERGIAEVVHSAGVEYTMRYRKFTDVGELDLYIPINGIAFEYNGLYWHSDERKDAHHLAIKQQKCATYGVRLVHISEHEWLNTPSIVANQILSILGATQKIEASECCVVDVSTVIRDEFLTTNCIHGSCRASINLGVYHRARLIGVAAIGRSRSSGTAQYELIRYSTVEGINVTDGIRLIVEHVRDNHQITALYTVCDNRWESGEQFTQAGFTKSHTLPPKSWYFKTIGRGIKMLSGTICQKHRLPRLLGDKFNPDSTEYENMAASGFKRIWDCGYTVYELNIDDTISML
jgi:hypothetical protein